MYINLDSKITVDISFKIIDDEQMTRARLNFTH